MILLDENCTNQDNYLMNEYEKYKNNRVRGGEPSAFMPVVRINLVI